MKNQFRASVGRYSSFRDCSDWYKAKNDHTQSGNVTTHSFKAFTNWKVWPNTWLQDTSKNANIKRKQKSSDILNQHSYPSEEKEEKKHV